MTSADLAAIRERANKATAGPWDADTSEATMNDRSEWRIGDKSRPQVARSVMSAADAAFIAHARQDIPALLDHIEMLEQDRREFAEALGFSHGYGEPAPLSEIFDSVQQWEQESRDHHECPVTCEQCGETLASTICEHCHGSGDNSSLAGYAECEWCGGAGKVHDCAETSYADLVAERDELRSRIDSQREGRELEQGMLVTAVKLITAALDLITRDRPRLEAYLDGGRTSIDTEAIAKKLNEIADWIEGK